LNTFDAVVITTDHSAFDYRLILEHSRSVVDTRNALGRVAGTQGFNQAAELRDVVGLGTSRAVQVASVAA
jgi:UDP-N-acetyl-D-mannosaminuronate dehydrogenase